MDYVVFCEEDEQNEKTHCLNTKKVDTALKESHKRKEREIQDYRKKMKNEGMELFRKYFGTYGIKY